MQRDPQSRLPTWGPRGHIISAAPVPSEQVETVFALGTRGALLAKTPFRLGPTRLGWEGTVRASPLFGSRPVSAAKTFLPSAKGLGGGFFDGPPRGVPSRIRQSGTS